MKIPNSAGISREKFPRNNKIQVLHLVTSLEPGGMENGVVNISNRLDPKKFSTTIACLERIGDFAKRLREDVNVVCFDKPPGFRFSLTPELARTIRSTGSDVLHTHNLGPLIYGVLGNVLAGGRSVILQGEHGQMRPDEMTPKRRWLRKIGYSACGAVHTVSAGLRMNLIEHGFSGEKIRVIINGVDCERFSPASPEERASLRERWKLEKDSVVLGIVGRFAAFKRHTRLIEAFERLSYDQPWLRLLIVGDSGPAREEILRKVEESPVKDKIVWVGYQPDPADFYKMMDLLVVPSDCEGLSNVMLEAMACAVPCLAHPACGANEVVVDGVNGYLREMATAEALASLLRGVVSDLPLLQVLGAGARKTAEVQFSLESMVAGYARLYEELAARKRGSGS
jgi:glycosyltransferase involved in cell wall biosynthesis